MEKLKINKVDLNDVSVVLSLIAAAQKRLNVIQSYSDIQIQHHVYFATPSPLPSEAGWYIILTGKHPVYVGEASCLNNRLNSKNGSRDNFQNKQRKSENQRNLVKKLCELNVISPLRVAVITESALWPSHLSCLDRKNIEKLLNICRSRFSYL